MMPLFCCQARGLGGSVIMFSRRMAVGGEEDGEWGQRYSSRGGRTWSFADSEEAVGKRVVRQ